MLYGLLLVECLPQVGNIMNSKTGPIFVIGNSRSGTTMLAQIMGRNSTIFSFNELHFFEQIWSTSDTGVFLDRDAAVNLYSYLLSVQRDGLFAPRDISKYIIEARNVFVKFKESLFTKAWVFRVFISVEAAANGKVISLEQTPRNVFYINDIKKLFPDSRFINIVRDPRAVLLSQKNKWKLRYLGLDKIPFTEAIRAWSNYHPIVMSKLWCSGINVAHSFDGSDYVRTIKFEELVERPDDVISSLCEWLGVPYEQDMLNINYWGSSREKTEENRKGIQANVATSWKKGGLSQEELYISQMFTSAIGRSYGYTPVPTNYSLIKLAYLYVLLPFKLSVALMLNLHRMRNIVDTLKRRLAS